MNMNRGIELKDALVELQRQARIGVRRDWIAPAPDLALVPYASAGRERPYVALTFVGVNNYFPPVQRWPHTQIAQYTEVPQHYYDRLLATPELLCANVNHWLREKPGERRLVRTLDGSVRAFLSNRYRPIDNYSLAENVLPTLAQYGATIESAAITDTRFYLKALIPSLTGEVRGSRQVGDVLKGGVLISNSDVGNGALHIALWTLRLSCLNGSVAESILRKAHLGRAALADLDEAREFFTDATRALDDATLWSKVNDVLRAVLRPEHFATIVDRASDATQQKLEASNVERVVEVATQRLGLAEGDRHSILTHLIEGGDLSRWGLSNAITAVANDLTDYEHSTACERAGGRVIELADHEWALIAEAKPVRALKKEVLS